MLRFYVGEATPPSRIAPARGPSLQETATASTRWTTIRNGASRPNLYRRLNSISTLTGDEHLLLRAGTHVRWAQRDTGFWR